MTESQHPLLHWWRNHVVATVDHRNVVERVQEDAGWNGRYAFMTLMSAGIAVLGLLLSSPAVVIGAMLISPLMGPIIGLGFAIATFDSREIRRTLIALVGGTALAVLFCAAIVTVSPLQNVTSEIASRTRPNLFDLMVALFSALAGAYAMIRGREGTVVGVAIATALMPPLAVIGFGLATANATVFLGALLLFFTNLMTIALSAAVMARIYGFAGRLSPQQTVVQTIAILATFVALAIPLGLTLRQVAWEALASRQTREVLTDRFGATARVSQIELDYDARPLKVSATVLTPHYDAAAQRAVAADLTRRLGRPVTAALEQYRVGMGSGEAETAQIANAQTSARQKEAAREADDLAERLALVAGAQPEAVLLDRTARRAVVTATPLPGAGIGVYHALESRVAASAPGWRVTLVPPPAALAPIEFDGDAPDAVALADDVWAAERLGLPVALTGTSAHTALVAEAMTKAGITATATAARGSAVRLNWKAPEPPAAPAPPQ